MFCRLGVGTLLFYRLDNEHTIFTFGFSSLVLDCELLESRTVAPFLSNRGRHGIQHNHLGTEVLLARIKWLNILGNSFFTHIWSFTQSALIPNWILSIETRTIQLQNVFNYYTFLSTSLIIILLLNSECKMIQPTLEESLALSYKTKHTLTIWSSNHVLLCGIYSKEWKTCP